MTCVQAMQELTTRPSRAISVAGFSHLARCSTCRDLARALSGSSGPVPTPAQLCRIQSILTEDLRPVSPLPSPPMLFAIMTLISVSVLIAGSAFFGLRGWHAFGLFRNFWLLAPALAGACALKVALMRQMVPGSGNALVPLIGASIPFVLSLAITGLMFARPEDSHFIRDGLRCSAAGTFYAIFASLLLLLASRRGAILSSPLLGATIGGLSGLIAMAGSDLRCPNLDGSHILMWHSGLALAAALAGLTAGAASAWVASAFAFWRMRGN